MRIAKSLAWTIVGGLAFGLVVSASAAPAPAVLGGDGELYRLVNSVSESGDPILLLSTHHPDGTFAVTTVPETEGAGVESSAHLIYEHSSRTLFLTWEERFNSLHQRIRLIGFAQGAWTDVIEVATSPFSTKGEPSLAATQDSFAVRGPEGAEETVSRTVLHVVWVEQGHPGHMISYAPVTLLNGRYIGDHPIIDLSALIQAETVSVTDLWQATAPVVAVADDDHSVTIGFVHPYTGRIVSTRITMLAGELSVLADELRSHLIDFGARTDWQSPEGLVRLADGLRSHLIDFGHRIDPHILRSIADDLRSHLIDFGAQYEPGEVRRLASDLRSHLIDFGFRLDDRGLRRANAASAAARIEMVAEPESTDVAPVSHVAVARPVTSWDLPAEATADASLLLSRSGREALLAWERNGALFYRETAKGEWGPVLRLPGSTMLGDEQKLRILENRVRNR